MRIRRLALIPLATVALIGAGCGGGGDDDKSEAGGGQTSNAESAAISADEILQRVKTSDPNAGPQEVELNASIAVSGSPTNPQAAAFLSKPITLSLKGTTAVQGTLADLSFSVAAGPLAVDGALRTAGDKGWVELNGQWYELPPGTFSQAGGGAGTLDGQTILKAFGDPSAVFEDPEVVGSENIGGVDTDHVKADVNLSALMQGVTSATSGLSPGAAPVDPAQLAQQAGDLEKYVETSEVDIWIGQDDHTIHKLAVAIEGKTDEAAQASSGIEGFDISFDVLSVPADPVDVAPPDNPAPFSQLQGDLGGLFGGLGAANNGA